MLTMVKTRKFVPETDNPYQKKGEDMTHTAFRVPLP